MEHPEELVWIKKIKAGETHYFSHLYDKYHRKLYTLCYRFSRNQADAEEQLQEIFLKMLEKTHSFREDSLFSTWLTRLAINHMINFQNREDQFRDKTDSINAVIDDKSDPVDFISAENSELSIMLDRSIANLPKGFQHVFILHDQLGLRHEEIGDVLGITAATSRSQLSRARVALRKLLKLYRPEKAS